MSAKGDEIQCRCIVNTGALIIPVDCPGRWNGIVGGTVVPLVERRRIVDADAPFTLPPHHRQRRDVQAKDKVRKEAREENVEAVLLLLTQLLPDGGCLGC
jgi:hypothetical protein